MKISRIVLFIVIFSSCLYAQGENISIQIPEGPRVYLDALSFSSNQGKESRLDVYIEIPYEGLQFVRNDEVFRSTCEVSTEITDSNDQHITEKIWNEIIETRDFSQTISHRTSDLIQKSFTLSPGVYDVIVQVQDTETKKGTKIEKRVKVRDYSDSTFIVSDVMLVNSVSIEDGKKIISPNISANVGELKDYFYLYYEAYGGKFYDSAMVSFIIRNSKGDIIQSDSAWQHLGASKNSCIQSVSSSKLAVGDYIIDMIITPVDKVGTLISNCTVSISRTFTIRWRGQPVTITELDLAIDQLQYITDKDQIDEMKNAQPEKKGELFREFWKEKDPTPNSERNELMEEYYARVEYTNKHFSHYTQGWKTDMGMVYIIFGPPNSIERHPFDMDAKPYEVWTYTEQTREFVFVDMTGFGDYRLQNPIWDTWRTRPR
jgi:GWxTD domain-containing protein